MSKQRFSFFKHRYSTTNKILPTQNIQSFASNRSPKFSRVLSKHVRTSSIDLYVLCRFANPKGANSAFFEINKISIDRRQFTAAPEDKRIAHASWKGERASSYSSSTPLSSREGRQPRGESGTEKRRRRLDLPIPRQIGTYQLVGHRPGIKHTLEKTRRGAALFDTRIHPLRGEGVCAAAASYVRGWHYIAEQSIHAVSTTNSLLHELSQPTLSIFRPQTISSSAVSRSRSPDSSSTEDDYSRRIFVDFPQLNLIRFSFF